MDSARTTHRVLMNFMDRFGWHISFLEADCQTCLPLKLTFATPDKIRTMFEHCGSGILEERQGLEMGISMGRGSAWLNLSEEQYRKLKHQRTV